MLDQLRQLAKQLQQKGCQNGLKQAMQQAGVGGQQQQRVMQSLTREDLDSEQKIKDALKKQGLSQQQIQQIMKQMKQARKNDPTGKMGQCMGGACSKLGDSPTAGNVQDAMNQLDGADSALSELEKTQQRMQQLLDSLEQAKEDIAEDLSGYSKEDLEKMLDPGERMAAGECDGEGECDGSGQGQGQGKGKGKGKGKGFGDPGGGGGVPPEKVTDTAHQRTQVPGQTGPGKAIAHSYVTGDQVKGEASAQLVEILTGEQERMKNPTVTEELPRHLHDIIIPYLDEIQKPAQRPEPEGGSE